MFDYQYLLRSIKTVNTCFEYPPWCRSCSPRRL